MSRKRSLSDKILRKIGAFLASKDIPLWVTLLIVIGGGWATKMYLPAINHQHEYSKMKATFVIQSLNDLNEQTSLLVALLTEIYGEPDLEISIDSKIKLTKVISSLQWEASEISMFVDGEAETSLNKYRLSLNEIRNCSGIATQEFDKSCLDRAVLNFLQSAEDLGKELASFR